ncbi:hypothetical protein SNEBB_001525, partial [Seison nebaliae]
HNYFSTSYYFLAPDYNQFCSKDSHCAVTDKKMKLYYFDITGKAEVIRYILHYKNVNFEDVQFGDEEWMAKYKSQMPLGQVPVLEINGRKYAQSLAIVRYLGSQFQLMGKDEMERLEVDMWMQHMVDMEGPIYKMYDLTEEEQKTKKGEFLQTLLPRIQLLEDQAAKNKGEWFFSNLSVVDFYWAGLEIWLKSMLGFDESKFPNLIKIRKNVLATEGVKKYVANRKIVIE